jgi:integrase
MPQVSLADQARLRTIFDTLKEQDREWKESDLERHLLTWERMTKRTVDQLMRDLRRLAAHPIVPVKLHSTRYDMVESFLRFLYHRENVEHKLGTATKNDFKAVLALAKYRGIPREVFPKRAPIIQQARDTLPQPEEIHALLHTTWTRDPTHSYEQHLIQYLLVYIFGFGVRAPSEAHALKVSDFDPNRHLIVIREPKKSKRTRRLYIEPEWLCCGKNRPSLNQYLKWRAKVDVGGTDAFFLKPNGEPFHNELAVARFLERRVKRKFPWFHCYLGRTWNANARLIQWDRNGTGILRAGRPRPRQDVRRELARTCLHGSKETATNSERPKNGVTVRILSCRE